MRSIKIFGPGETTWQLLPNDADDFESSAIKLCDLIVRGDERVGKIPDVRKRKKSVL